MFTAGYGHVKFVFKTFGYDNTLFHKHKEMIMVAKIVIFVDKTGIYEIFNIWKIKPHRVKSV